MVQGTRFSLLRKTGIGDLPLTPHKNGSTGARVFLTHRSHLARERILIHGKEFNNETDTWKISEADRT